MMVKHSIEERVMKKYILMILLLVGVSACTPNQPEGPYVAVIGDYVVTQAEFMKMYEGSIFAREDSIESRKVFLDNLINQKLILLDAQAKNLDKKQDFLESVQRFWEQALLKVALEQKNKEMSGEIQVSEKEVELAYQQMSEEQQNVLSYAESYPQLKWQVTRAKEASLMEKWIDDLRQTASIHINESVLMGQEK